MARILAVQIQNLKLRIQNFCFCSLVHDQRNELSRSFLIVRARTFWYLPRSTIENCMTAIRKTVQIRRRRAAVTGMNTYRIHWLEKAGKEREAEPRKPEDPPPC